MKKHIKKINLGGCVAEIYKNKVVISEKGDNHSITLNSYSEVYMMIMYYINQNDNEGLEQYLKLFALNTFSHISLWSNVSYIEEYEKFAQDFTKRSMERNYSEAKDEKEIIDELKLFHNAKKCKGAIMNTTKQIKISLSKVFRKRGFAIKRRQTPYRD